MSITRIPPSGIDTQALSAVLGRGTVAYSTLQQLPLTNNSTGSTAFVSENNRLYIWNGTGWFNIALINTSPTITTGPSATYSFATNGTPVVITLVAQDPEGIPITWSHQVTSGTLGSTATITQANNVFTITPSTNTAHAGVFGVTFTASDGVNVATATSSFTLSFGPTTIGQAFGGGFYAGQISTTGNGVATHYLVVGPASTAQNASVQWKTGPTTTAGTTSAIDGPTNSANMNNANHPAAQFCEGLVIGGFSDWYMPARNELEVCYFNLKPTATANTANWGINTNAVPSRNSNYGGAPSTTSASAFSGGSSEAFAIDLAYWSSTQDSTSTAWRLSFSNGYQEAGYKANFRRVRAVRRVPV